MSWLTTNPAGDGVETVVNPQLTNPAGDGLEPIVRAWRTNDAGDDVELFYSRAHAIGFGDNASGTVMVYGIAIIGDAYETTALGAITGITGTPSSCCRLASDQFLLGCNRGRGQGNTRLYRVTLAESGPTVEALSGTPFATLGCLIANGNEPYAGRSFFLDVGPTAVEQFARLSINGTSVTSTYLTVTPTIPLGASGGARDESDNILVAIFGGNDPDGPDEKLAFATFTDSVSLIYLTGPDLLGFGRGLLYAADGHWYETTADDTLTRINLSGVPYTLTPIAKASINDATIYCAAHPGN